jgi:hypothetical protein
MRERCIELGIAGGLTFAGGWLVFWLLSVGSFIFSNHRFPNGAGEILNWVLGL